MQHLTRTHIYYVLSSDNLFYLTTLQYFYNTYSNDTSETLENSNGQFLSIIIIYNNT